VGREAHLDLAEPRPGVHAGDGRGDGLESVCHRVELSTDPDTDSVEDNHVAIPLDGPILGRVAIRRARALAVQRLVLASP